MGYTFPIFLNLKKCFLRKKVKVTLTCLNGTICFWYHRIVGDVETKTANVSHFKVLHCNVHYAISIIHCINRMISKTYGERVEVTFYVCYVKSISLRFKKYGNTYHRTLTKFCLKHFLIAPPEMPENSTRTPCILQFNPFSTLDAHFCNLQFSTDAWNPTITI